MFRSRDLSNRPETVRTRLGWRLLVGMCLLATGGAALLETSPARALEPPTGAAASATERAGAPTPTCAIDPRLVGDWSGVRLERGHPTWRRLRLGCDCTVQSRADADLETRRERGVYEIQGDQLVLHLGGGREEWPFRVDEGQLFLREGDPRAMELRFRQTVPRTCEAPGRGRSR